MAFNPNSYKPSAPKCLPVILLLDVSGSMSENNKIQKLHEATINMVDTFNKQRVMETNIKVCFITFGSEVKLHAPSTNDSPYVDVVDAQAQGISQFVANGITPLGMALKMAKDLIEDKDYTPGKWYAPAVVLVSDGNPNDEWHQPFDEFLSIGRSSKCQRLAISVDYKDNIEMLKEFVGDEKMLFVAETANDIVDAFKKVTLSITQRASQSNPDAGLLKNSGSATAPRVATQRPIAAKPVAPKPSVKRPIVPSNGAVRPAANKKPNAFPKEVF